MPYAQIDDRLAIDPGFRSLSFAARGLFATGRIYAACALTDGELDELFVKDNVRGRGSQRAVDELVRAGFWQPSQQGGYQDVHYLADNRTRAQVEEDRASSRERQRRRRAQQTLPWNGSGPERVPP